MALDIGLMESDGNKFVSELKTQSRSSVSLSFISFYDHFLTIINYNNRRMVLDTGFSSETLENGVHGRPPDGP